MPPLAREGIILLTLKVWCAPHLNFSRAKRRCSNLVGASRTEQLCYHKKGNVNSGNNPFWQYFNPRPTSEARSQVVRTLMQCIHSSSVGDGHHLIALSHASNCFDRAPSNWRRSRGCVKDCMYRVSRFLCLRLRASAARPSPLRPLQRAHVPLPHLAPCTRPHHFGSSMPSSAPACSAHSSKRSPQRALSHCTLPIHAPPHSQSLPTR